MIHGQVFLHNETEIARANDLKAYLWVRCRGHSHIDPKVEGDKDPGHGPNFQISAAALNLRTKEDVGFEVRWRANQ
jgi:hypothetical protein